VKGEADAASGSAHVSICPLIGGTLIPKVGERGDNLDRI
jgi:hypothetical protein